MSIATIASYYRAFNEGDATAMLALLSDDVVHDINQGAREHGKAAFAAFIVRMEHAYREQLLDIVIMADATNTRFAAEFTVFGSYLQAERGLPAAHGQTYRLPAGAFLEVRDGKISRVSMYYNLPEWLKQVGPKA